MLLPARSASASPLELKRSVCVAGLELAQPTPKRHKSMPAIFDPATAPSVVEDKIARAIGQSSSHVANAINKVCGAHTETKPANVPEAVEAETSIDQVQDELTQVPATFTFRVATPEGIQTGEAYVKRTNGTRPSSRASGFSDLLVPPHKKDDSPDYAFDPADFMKPSTINDLGVGHVTSPSPHSYPSVTSPSPIRTLEVESLTSPSPAEQHGASKENPRFAENLAYAHELLLEAIVHVKMFNNGQLDAKSFAALTKEIKQSPHYNDANINAGAPITPSIEADVKDDAEYDENLDKDIEISLISVGLQPETEPSNLSQLHYTRGSTTQASTTTIERVSSSNDDQSIEALIVAIESPYKTEPIPSSSHIDAAHNTEPTTTSATQTDAAQDYEPAITSSTQIDNIILVASETQTEPASESASVETRTNLPPEVVFPTWREVYIRQLRLIRRAKALVPSINVVHLRRRIRREYQAAFRQAATTQATNTQPQSSSTLQVNGKAPRQTSYLQVSSSTNTSSLTKNNNPVTINLLDSDDEDGFAAIPESDMCVGRISNENSSSNPGNMDLFDYEDEDDMFITHDRDSHSRDTNSNSEEQLDKHIIAEMELDADLRIGGASSDRDMRNLDVFGNLASFRDVDNWTGDESNSKTDLDSDSDEDIDGAGKPEDVAFYGIGDHETAEQVKKLLRYQNTNKHVGKHPSPKAGHRLKFEQYSYDVGSRLRKKPSICMEKILKDTSWADPIQDDDASFKSDFLQGGHQIMKGLPLVENVEMVVAANHARPNGDCYHRAVATLLYGSDEMWALTKAEHLCYVWTVLSDERHPRHELYKQLNAKFYATSSPASAFDGKFKANIYQLLHMAHTWTPAVMQQITADLYNIHIITFSFCQRTQEVTEVSVRGSYNSRHIFLAFLDDNHFAPMVPNHYKASEFQYPRVTIKATEEFTHAPKSTSTKSTTQHPWRNEYTSEVLPPVPRAYGCDLDALRQLMGTRIQ